MPQFGQSDRASSSADRNRTLDIVSALEELVTQAAAESAQSTAEGLVYQYFDEASRNNGMAISREGAGKFQADILRDSFEVSSVKLVEGAVVFEGKILVKDASELSRVMEEKLSKSPMQTEVGYTLMRSERTPNLDKGLEQAALDVMLGSCPAVVLFPLSWNSTVQANAKSASKVVWRNLLSSCAVATSGFFAARSLGMLDPQNSYAQSGIFPPDFAFLALAPIYSQALCGYVEKLAAGARGIKTQSQILPTLSLFHFGSRSSYLTMPRSRNDLFDAAAVGAAFSVVSSLCLFFFGLTLTSQAPREALDSFPTISLAILQTNTVINQGKAVFRFL